MGDILVDSDLEAVRALVYSDATDLPDAVLTSFPFLPFVEALVKGGITDWATLKATSTQNWTLVKTGTACLLALRAVTLRLRSSAEVGGGFKVGGYSESGTKVEWTEVVAQLKEEARKAFALVSTRTFNRRSGLLFSGPTSSGTIVPETFEGWIDRVLPRVLDWEAEGGEDDTVTP